jgi:hypothetical protein
MPDKHPTTEDNAASGMRLPRASAVDRYEVAKVLPFFLRAWWLHDMDEYQDLDFSGETEVTVTPLWSLYSDPVCDVSNVDCGSL